MTKQLMIYDKAVPLSSELHRNFSVRTGIGFGFSKGVNALPLVVAEFEKATAEYAIVFAGEGEGLFPAVVLGLRDQENLFLNADDSWNANYVPAFLRRYPFVFSQEKAGGDLTLCIDTSFAGLNSDGRGERLFDADGNGTRYMKETLNFTTEYQSQHNATRAFTDRLRELDLLEAAEVKGTLPDGVTLSLKGFWRIDPVRLAALDDAVALEMYRSGMLGLCYMHLASLNHVSGLIRRVAELTGKATETA